MTVIMQSEKPMKFRSVIFLFIAIAALYACNKANDLPPAVPKSTLLNVINSTADTVNFYVNGTRQNDLSSIYANGATGYLAVNSGIQNYQFRKNGHAEVLFSKPLSLDTIPTKIRVDTLVKGTNPIVTTTYIKGYSLFMAGETADKAFLVKDTLVAYNQQPAVRFAHTADGAGALDIAINDTLYFQTKGFKSVSQFKSMGPGIKTIKVYQSGNTGVIVATQKVTLTAATDYTLYVKGLPNGIGKSALAVGIFVNTY